MSLTGITKDNGHNLTFEKEVEKMSKDIAVQFETRVQELRQYAAILENHHDLYDEGARPRIFSQLSYGYRRAVEAVAWASFLRDKAVARRKQAEAIAAHDTFGDYVDEKRKNGKEVKETDGMRKWYVDMDVNVLQAKHDEAITTAILEQFTGLKFEFIQGSSTLKAMFYGVKDGKYINSATISAEIGE